MSLLFVCLCSDYILFFFFVLLRRWDPELVARNLRTEIMLLSLERERLALLRRCQRSTLIIIMADVIFFFALFAISSGVGFLEASAINLRGGTAGELAISSR